MAEKFLAKSKYDPADPAVIEREAKRKAILEAQLVRDAERAKRKAEEAAAEAARRAEEEAARQEQLRVEALAREAEAQRGREEAERLEYERKLERDARYAARKERKKKKKIGLRTVRLSRPRFDDPRSRFGRKVSRGRELRTAERGCNDGSAALGRRRSRRGRDEPNSASAEAARRVHRAGGARIRRDRL